jgi:hypothetical protein
MPRPRSPRSVLNTLKTKLNEWSFAKRLNDAFPRVHSYAIGDWLRTHWLPSIIFLAICVLGPLLYSAANPNNFEERLRTLTAIGTGIGALALFINLLFTRQTVENSRQTLSHQRKSQQDERFFKAAELLGNERSIDARIAALFALEHLANDSDDHYGQVIEVISTFVRRRSDELSSEGWGPEKTPQDIEAAVTILGRRRKALGRGEQNGINLRGAFLRRIALRNGEFQLADLTDANLMDAELKNCNFADARFVAAKLQNGKWSNCILINADFRQADATSLQIDFDDGLPNPYLRVATLMTREEGDDAPPVYGMTDHQVEEPVNEGIFLDGSYWSDTELQDASVWGDLFRSNDKPLNLSGMRGMSRLQYDVLEKPSDTIPPSYLYDPEGYEQNTDEADLPF